MKTLIAAAALSLIAGAAFAGEGEGNPFPFASAPISVSTVGVKQALGVAQNPFPYTAPGQLRQSNGVLPSTGSAGVLQTVNSLPRGFEDGAPSITNLNRQSAPPTLVAQPAGQIASTHG